MESLLCCVWVLQKFGSDIGGTTCNIDEMDPRSVSSSPCYSTDRKFHRTFLDQCEIPPTSSEQNGLSSGYPQAQHPGGKTRTEQELVEAFVRDAGVFSTNNTVITYSSDSMTTDNKKSIPSRDKKRARVY